MTTQSLRGMDNHGPMHWRGDRTGFDDVPVNAQPDTGVFDESKAFNELNDAFVTLLGCDQELAPGQMQAFTDFALQITYPPNPIRALDTASPRRKRGARITSTTPSRCFWAAPRRPAMIAT